MIKTHGGATIGTAPPAIKRFLRKKQVKEATGLPDSSIYAEMAKGTFPKPIKLSANRVAWLEDEIAVWQAERLAQRGAA